MCPDKHLEASELLGYDIRNAKRDDAGKIVADVLRRFMDKMKIPDGLTSLGYTKDDIPELVKGALPQVYKLFLHWWAEETSIEIDHWSSKYRSTVE